MSTGQAAPQGAEAAQHEPRQGRRQAHRRGRLQSLQKTGRSFELQPFVTSPKLRRRPRSGLVRQT